MIRDSRDPQGAALLLDSASLVAFVQGIRHR
ncbi:DUF397 domain-containing protein [Streptomyces sp. NPDC006446]